MTSKKECDISKHDPHLYIVEEHYNKVDRNNFVMRYLEARSNEKILA